jgi:hypothetical protein
VLDGKGAIVNAEVVRVPGLEPGTRVRLTAREVRGMERFEPIAKQPAETRSRRVATTGVVPNDGRGTDHRRVHARRLERS